MDLGLEHMQAVAGAVDSIVAQRFDGEAIPFDDVLQEAQRRREAGDIRCAAPSWDRASLDGRSMEAGGIAYIDKGLIYVNVEGGNWAKAVDLWHQGRDYGALDPLTIEQRVSTASWDEFAQLKQQARGWYLGPSLPARYLAHEAAHLATGQVHEGGRFALGADGALTDEVIEIGLATQTAIYWELWQLESARLDELYVAAHQDQ